MSPLISMKMLEYRESSRLRSPSYLIYREIHTPERTAGYNEQAGGVRGKDNIYHDGMDWAAKSRPAPPSSRRYHRTGRPCPQDGIIKPTESLEKKLTRLTPKWCRTPFFFLSQFCLLALLSGELCVGRSALPQSHWVVDDALCNVARTKKDLRTVLAAIKVGNKVVLTF